MLNLFTHNDESFEEKNMKNSHGGDEFGCMEDSLNEDLNGV